ncbi:MAG: ATP-grasp domain-containing protein [Bacteroidia bacterium]
MKPQAVHILISGARAPIALEMARSFKKWGCKVIMMDSVHLTIARWSNKVDEYYVVPSPRFFTQAFVKEVREIIQKENITHFIPTCEEAIFVSQHIEIFKCKVWTSPLSLVLKLHNKYSFTHFNAANFPIPPTQILTEFTDWENSSDYVFKPIYSRFASAVIINKKLNSNDIPDEEKPKWIAQKKVIGKEICIYSIWDNGKLKAYASYHPLYRAGKGAGVYFEPVFNDLVRTYVQGFGESINYTGQLSFDVIIDENEIPYFIECNPRGTSGAHLLHENLAKAFLQNERFILEDKTEYCIKYAMFILHFFAYFHSRTLKAKDVILKRNDIKPFVLQVLSLLEITYIKFSRNMSWLEASTSDIEWNHDEN